mmetsp:Transcript_38258/g.83999  ORF Transcript_38258/g.83999 Transcript_38258/m.83999 type:complete len:83 (-) Transcript_38258:578-826(-)
MYLLRKRRDCRWPMFLAIWTVGGDSSAEEGTWRQRTLADRSASTGNDATFDRIYYNVVERSGVLYELVLRVGSVCFVGLLKL